MALEDTPNSATVQDFQQAQAAVTERQGDQSTVQTREPAIPQLEDYKARNENYAPLRELQQEQPTFPESQVQQSATQSREPEPTRSDEVRQQGFVQGGPDYVSATTAAAMNAAMLNQDKPAPSEAKETPTEPVVDRAVAEANARDRVAIENEQNAQKRIAELAERFGNKPSTPGREQQQEQDKQKQLDQER